MPTQEICCFCEQAPAIEQTYSETFKIGDSTVTAHNLKKMVCTECASESIPLEFFDENSEKIKAAIAFNNKTQS